MNTTKTGFIDAWLPGHDIRRPHEVHDMEGNQLVAEAGFAAYDMSGSGWVRIGTAKITIELVPVAQCIKETIEAMRKEQGALHAKASKIEGQIQNLLTIGYEVRHDKE